MTERDKGPQGDPLAGFDFEKIEVRRVFDYDRSLLPNSYLAEIDSAKDLQSALLQSCLTVGYPSWNLLYYSCYCALPWATPEVRVLETGTNTGMCSIILAQALKDRGCTSKLQTVEILPLAVELAKQHVANAGLTDFVEFHNDDSRRFLKRYVQSIDHIHFAFLDSNHERDFVVEEFEIIHPFLKPGVSTVFFDNTESEGVAEALAHIRSEFGGNFVSFPNCSWGPPGNVIWQP